jgi:hypothetical protein
MRSHVAGGLARIADRLDPQRLHTEQVDDSGRSWSPESVIAQAVEACHGEGGRSTFSRSELARQIYLALPDRLGLEVNGTGRELVE